jgi:hypothetical protein
MKMKPDDLERRIGRQPLRPIPPEWREQILAAARQAGAPVPAARLQPRERPWRSLLSSLDSLLAPILWPSPKAWAGLATLWIGILGLHLATRESPGPVAKRVAPPLSEILMARAQQERLLAELMPRQDWPATARPKRAPVGPRSEGAPGRSSTLPPQPRLAAGSGRSLDASTLPRFNASMSLNRKELS